jgi:acetyl esterase/lipase
MSNKSMKRVSGYGNALKIVFAFLISKSVAQNAEILLWPKGAPLANGMISTGTASTDKPSITPYPATNPNGAAVIVFPGGAYLGLGATPYEGTSPAQWLASKGISGFVVKYRYSPYHHPVEMSDGQRAVRWVKANAAKYGIDTARVGVLGFSAGGHLASTVSTHYDGGNPSAADSIDRHPCRPAFSILGYPVITMQASFTHGQSRDALLGTSPAPSQALIDSLSSEKQVNSKTPPAFLFHATDDGLVPIRNPQEYYDSCQKKGVPATFMKFDHGGHGFGMADGKAGKSYDAVLNRWCDSSLKWLDKQGFLTPKTSSLLSSPAHPALPARAPLLLLQAPSGTASDALGRRPKAIRAPVDSKKP